MTERTSTQVQWQGCVYGFMGMKLEDINSTSPRDPDSTETRHAPSPFDETL